MSGRLGGLQGVFGTMRSQFSTALDRVFPPAQRAETMEKLQDFAVNNPKLAAFLLVQIAFTGFPLLVFVVFGITVVLFALAAALLTGIIAALLLTVFMAGVALFVLLPTVFVTTLAATFTFLWGLGGYYLLAWFSERAGAAPDGKAIGDKLNSLTGGRIGWLVDGSRQRSADAPAGVHQTPNTNEVDGNGHATNENVENEDEEKENGTATSTESSDANRHAYEGKETHNTFTEPA